MSIHSEALQYFDVIAAKKAARRGENVTKFLRKQLCSETNTPAIIEASYDMQAGMYIKAARDNRERFDNYYSEISCLLQNYCEKSESMLDIGTGEMTTLSGIIARFECVPRKIFAFDISWSRIYEGLNYISSNPANKTTELSVFVGDIAAIPLRTGSIDIITSSHALEPNGGRLDVLLKELLRVVKKRLVLFEPCYEINSPEGKKRMDEHGYIKNVAGVAEAVGGKLIDMIDIKNSINKLNPTVCFVIEPQCNDCCCDGDTYTVPGTDFPLVNMDGFYFSNETGLSFPIIKDIPILRPDAGILTTSLVGLD